MSKDWIVIIGLFILIGFAWSILGGPIKKYEIPTFNNGFEKNEESTKEEEKTVISTLEEGSIYKGKITINKRASDIKETKVDEEYIVIEAYRKNDSPINITGWKLVSSVSKSSYVIPKAQNIPKIGQTESDVILNAKDKAIVTTGRSPIGESFRTNICTGYFEQFQDFFPRIEKDCVSPEDEIGISQFNLECTDFIDTLPKCEMRVAQIPVTLSNSCQEFINTQFNYNGCIASHRDDNDFYSDEWRIFLGRDQEIWQDRREIISLFDGEDNVVDTITY